MKGAIQMSIGFIVAIVFAVILLSLFITWMQGFFGQITVITEDLTQEASIKIKDTFKNTDSNFAVWPNEWTMDRGTELKLLAGIKNNAPDTQSHYYMINVLAPAGHPQESLMNSWVDRTPFSSPQWVDFGSDLEIPVTITPTGVGAGTYTFDVIACEVSSTASMGDCDTRGDQNFGGSSKYIRITLE
jgi:hypothetical protein